MRGTESVRGASGGEPHGGWCGGWKSPRAAWRAETSRSGGPATGAEKTEGMRGAAAAADGTGSGVDGAGVKKGVGAPADADETLDPATVIRARVFAGYAGWGAGQLESELDEEAWVVIPAHIDDCFTERPEELWKQALRRHGGHLAMFSLQPEDPSLN